MRLRTGFSGSSPRGRGTPARFDRSPPWSRFIPARAGNSSPRWRISVSSAVHPRAGGELIREQKFEDYFYGSSPRGRGTPAGADGCRPGERFIPARAGNSRRWASISMPSTVHPRAGGELSVWSWRRPVSCGSSPRGRGTRPGWYRPGRVGRFIPARAGNSDAATCCFADCLTVSFPDCFARQAGRFPGLFGRFDEARAGCRTAVGASSRFAAPALRSGPSGDPPPSARLSASMAVSGAFGHGPIARRIVVVGA